MSKRISAAVRMAVCLALLASCIMLAARAIGLFPDSRMAAVEGRLAVCEGLAVNCSIAASQGRFQAVTENLRFLVERNPAVISAGLRRADGRLVAEAGPHSAGWEEARGSQNDGCVVVPILQAQDVWGHVEVRYKPIYGAGLLRHLDPTLLGFLGFTASLSAIMFWLFLRRTLRVLNPSKVVPTRVRAALDTMAEGIVLLDKSERIMLANKSFASTAGRDPDDLIGLRVQDLPWASAAKDQPIDLPWRTTTDEHRAQAGGALALRTTDDNRRVFAVNSCPILDDRGQYQGALASFADVTELEEQKSELVSLLDALRRSRDEIRQQNDDLKILATRDPLTACLNRRTFFELFETHWKAAGRYGHPLCCVLVDIDHFKFINDNHGHSTGDDVLRRVGSLLMRQARESDVVCRYGGEEFCVLLPHTDMDAAFQAAERIRQAISEVVIGSAPVTASLGVSSNGCGAQAPQQLLDQADKCLYAAKRNGRNQSVRWDQAPADLEIDRTPTAQPRPESPADDVSPIPFQAVSALMSALAYRDAETAAHSMRVADLAVLLARKHMSTSDAYIVEVAALLHDIGKIGVPDSILLKPGRLSAEEWQVMALHDRFGVEIVNSSFRCELLTQFIATHHALYGGDAGRPHLPQGEDIPLGARIISIADAYDAMVSDRVYRKGRPMEEACQELLRCAGRQFDPQLVEEFIEMVRVSQESRQHGASQVAREAALSIGMQIERLVRALDARDFDGLKALVDRLQATAERYRVPQIAAAAQEIGRLVDADVDLKALLEQTHELLDLCRHSHASVLRQATQRP